MTQFVNEARAGDATRPAVRGRCGIKRWGGTNAFSMKWAKPCYPTFLVTMADFF